MYFFQRYYVFFQINIYSQPSLFMEEQMHPYMLSNLISGIHFDKAIVAFCFSKCYVWSNYFIQSATLSEDLYLEYLPFLSTSLASISFRAALTFLNFYFRHQYFVRIMYCFHKITCNSFFPFFISVLPFFNSFSCTSFYLKKAVVIHLFFQAWCFL